MSGGSRSAVGEDAPAQSPGLSRRMACFAYEGLLLFGVVMMSGYLYASLTQQRHALQGRHGLQAFEFLVLGTYFSWFWSHGGQTVAMKAWQIRLVGRRDQAVGQARALARYILSWIWFAPALVLVATLQVRSLGAIFGIVLGGIALYATSARLHPERQFWHDALCGTKLVESRR